MEIDIEKLICEIQKRRHLYDTTTAEYSDRNVKKKLWEEVCVQLIADWDKLEIQDKIKQGKFLMSHILKLKFYRIAMRVTLVET